MQTLKMENISMNNMFVKKVGFSYWEGESWIDYYVFNSFCFFFNRRRRWPFISFKWIPF